MGRRLYLEYLAWGRACWAPPEENNWDHVEQQSTPSLARPSEPIDGQNPQEPQQYDDSLRPTNPRAQRLGKDLRRAANDILSVIGVVRKTDHIDPQKDHQLERAEAHYVPPIYYLSVLSHSLSTQWITGTIWRLLAVPPLPNQSFLQTISEDYSILGPKGFFIGGLLTDLTTTLLRPAVLAYHAWYGMTRVIISQVSNGKTRQDLITISNAFILALQMVLPTITFPLWLHSMAQNFGLLPFRAMPPSLNVLFSIYRLGFTKLALPFICFLYYEICSRELKLHYIRPVVKSAVEDAFQSVHRSRLKPSPATMRPGLNGANHQQPQASEGPNQTIRNAQNTRNTQELSPHPVNGNGAAINQTSQPPRNQRTPRNNTQGAWLEFVDDTREDLEPVANTVPPQTADQQNLTTPTREQVPALNSTNSRRARVDHEINHQIRISELEIPGGQTVPELNIHLYEPLPTASDTKSATNPRRTSPLSLLSENMLVTMTTNCLGAMISLPIDCFLMPQLARWWVETSGLHGPMTSSARVAQIMLPSTPLFTYDSLFSMGTLWRKVLLGLAIRELITLGVWIGQTQGIIWLGKKKFKWGQKDEKV